MPEGLLLFGFSARLLSTIGDATEVDDRTSLRSDVHTLLREKHARQIGYSNHSGQYPGLNRG